MAGNEEWYDKEIAPILLELANKCGDRGMAFVSVVEYEAGKRSQTTRLPDGSGLAMVMLNHCAKMGENVDGYVLGLKRYCDINGIDTGSSIVMVKAGVA